MKKLVVARAADLDALYVNGILAVQKEEIIIDDILLSVGREPHSLKKVYVDEKWFSNQQFYNFPEDVNSLVLAD